MPEGSTTAKDTAEAPRMEAPVTSEKRPMENGEGEEPINKKAKVEDRFTSGDGLKRVAEIVLVLSTMAAMRGGRTPTVLEAKLMVEARDKLVDVCARLAPKDIVARETIATIIDDLGLNAKVNDQRSGNRVPKMTIAERFSLSKKKMEEKRKFLPHQPLQTGFTEPVDGHGHTVSISSDKSGQIPVSSVGISASTPVIHVSAATTMPFQYQTPTNEVKPVPTMMPNIHLGRDSASLTPVRLERSVFKVEGRPNGSSTVQMPANSSANQPLVNAPMWSVQTQSSFSGRSGPENKVTNHASVKFDGTGDGTASRMTTQAARDQNFRPFITQTASGNLSNMHQPVQVTNTVQAPIHPNNHAEISRVIQRLLQPKVPDQPTWTPPSRDYMNKALTCQICNLGVNEVDNVLICDNCEKGFHLICLQQPGVLGAPRGEWHCMACLTKSNGKPLPPKYGRVMRSAMPPNTPQKEATNVGGIQHSPEKKPSMSDPNVNLQHITTNGGAPLHSSASSGGVGSNCVEVPADTNIESENQVHSNVISSCTNNNDKDLFTGTDPNISTKPIGSTSSSAAVVSLSGDCAQDVANSNPPENEQRSNMTNLEVSESESIHIKADALQPSCTLQTVGQTELPNVSSISFNNNGLNDNNTNDSQRRENNPTDSEATEFGRTYNESDALQSSHTSLVVGQSGSNNNCEVPTNNVEIEKDLNELHRRENSDLILTCDVKQDSQDVALAHINENSGSNVESKQLPSFASDGKQVDVAIANINDNSGSNIESKQLPSFASDGKQVEWVGDVIQVEAEKKFYNSCSVDSITYKLQDHVLFHFSPGKLTPSKLQCMWEDSNTGLKWVVVKKYYFPTDLPDNIGSQYPPEGSEVYESNCDCTAMVDNIRGPCEIMPPSQFREEIDSRSHLSVLENSEVKPLFLCRLLYDESKGLLQLVENYIS